MTRRREGRRPVLLDLYCDAGGSAVGYHRAGFDVVGVDHAPQPRYPFRLVVMDALEAMRVLLDGGAIEDTEGGRWYLRDFAAIHASPPCQAYSIMRNLPWLRHKKYPRLIEPTRELLVATGRPWVIENVMGAKLAAGWLCGTMFGLPFYRHRAFETSFFWLQPGHPRHRLTVRAGHTIGGRARDFIIGHGNGTGKNGVAAVKEAVGIDWMTGDELTNALPPVYCHYIGRHLLAAVAEAEVPA